MNLDELVASVTEVELTEGLLHWVSEWKNDESDIENLAFMMLHSLKLSIILRQGKINSIFSCIWTLLGVVVFAPRDSQGPVMRVLHPVKVPELAKHLRSDWAVQALVGRERLDCRLLALLLLYDYHCSCRGCRKLLGFTRI
jgi:hypothetical protein